MAGDFAAAAGKAANETRRGGERSERGWRPWWTPLALAAFAVVWTWPAAVSGQLLGQWPDVHGTAWLIDAAPRLVRSLTDGATGWPEPVTYIRPDSFTLMWLGAALPFVPPVWMHAGVQLVGVTLSAWAAEFFARALGARAPWSLLAGIAFTTCGLASTALLEGYAYHLLDPWLPMLAWAWYRATSPSATVTHGVLAGIAWLLTLFTTAWLGMAGAVLVVGFLAGAIRRDGWSVRRAPILAAAATVLGPAIVYFRYFFAAGAGDVDTGNAAPIALQLEQTAMRFAGPMPSTDIDWHSQSANTPAFVVALVLVAPAVLARHHGWRTAAVTGLGALMVSMTPRVAVDSLPTWVPSWAQTAVAVLDASFLRFPDRIGWTWILCAGGVAACVATELATRRPRAALGLFAIAAIDAFGVARNPWRQEASPAAVPSAYDAQEGPVLDLWPEDIDPSPWWTLRTTNTGCYYQTVHGRPIADHCIFNPGEESPRLVVGRWLISRLMAGESSAAATKLGELGFRTVAFHGDLFHPGDRERLGKALDGIDPSPTVSTDGGEWIAAYAIPKLAGANPAAEWSRWSR